MQGCKDTRIQGYKDIRIQGHKDTSIKGYNNKRIQEYNDTKIHHIGFLIMIFLHLGISTKVVQMYTVCQKFGVWTLTIYNLCSCTFTINWEGGPAGLAL